MDPSFFSIGKATPGGSSTVEKEKPDGFAEAIGRRFSDNAPMLTARLSPIAQGKLLENPFDAPRTSSPETPERPSVHRQSSVTAPMSNMTLRSPPSSSQGNKKSSFMMPKKLFSSGSQTISLIKASELTDLVKRTDILFLDLRPNSAFSESRLRGALSITVPSMLLKRPNFGLDKLSQALPSDRQRKDFDSWSQKAQIIAYDTDTARVDQNPNMTGLLGKFSSAGFSGKLRIISGGFVAIPENLVELSSLGNEKSASESSHLRSSNLPQAAFQQSSTTSAMRRPGAMSSASSEGSSQAHGAAGPSSTRLAPANPFYDNIRQNVELSGGAMPGIPLRLTEKVRQRIHDLPFQWLREVARSADREETAEALSMQFYRIEVGEQRRLQGIMDHHSAVTNADTHSDFPYAITSGFEMGQKNR